MNKTTGMVSGYHELLLMIIQHAGDPTLPKNKYKRYKGWSARKTNFRKNYHSAAAATNS